MNNTDRYNDDMPTKSSGKGFYVALAVCLVAVCGVAVSGFIGGLSTDAPTPTTTRKPAVTTKVQQVVIPATNVTDDRTTVTTQTTTAAVTTTATTKADLFVFPATNQVLTPYSEELLYSETLGSWNTHNGVDFLAESGSRVKTIADGTIVRVYHDGLWGDVIEVDHGGKIVSRYCGVKATGVREGDFVKVGAAIGVITDVPAEITEKTHLHLEILSNNKYVDPLLLIRGETVTVTEN